MCSSWEQILQLYGQNLSTVKNRATPKNLPQAIFNLKNYTKTQPNKQKSQMLKSYKTLFSPYKNYSAMTYFFCMHSIWGRSHELICLFFHLDDGNCVLADAYYYYSTCKTQLFTFCQVNKIVSHSPDF